MVKHKSKYSCNSAIYFDLDPEIIKANCKFMSYYNKTDITPTVYICLHVHWLRLHCKNKIILYNFYLLIPLRFSSKLEDMKLTTSAIILWAVLAILIEIMLGKNEDNSTQSNITQHQELSATGLCLHCRYT